VATVPNGWFSREMGNPAAFDGFLVQVNPKKTGRIYLSVTQKQSQNYIYDLLDKTIVLLDPNMESMRTFSEKPETNLLQMEADLKLSADKKISGSIGLRAEGIVNPYFRLYKDSSYVKNLLTGDIPSSQMDKPVVTSLTELKTAATINIQPTAVKSDLGGYLVIELPRFKTGFDSWNLSQFMGSGTTPVKLDHHLWENYTYSIETPTGFLMVTPPMDMTFKNVLGDLHISISQKGNIITVKRSWEHSHDVITADNLDEFREMIKAWEDPRWRKIVLKASSTQ
jgi:hypothetical protein